MNEQDLKERVANEAVANLEGVIKRAAALKWEVSGMVDCIATNAERLGMDLYRWQRAMRGTNLFQIIGELEQTAGEAIREHTKRVGA